MGGQTSGSISLDTSDLADQLVKAIAPIMVQINENMTRLAGLLASTALDHDDATGVLAVNLPMHVLTSETGPSGEAIARYQAESLARAGYAVVAVGGEARKVTDALTGQPVPVIEIQPIVAPSAAQAAREDEWFDLKRTD